VKKDDIKKSLNEEKQYFNFRSGITKEVYTKVDEGFEKELQKLVHKIHSDQFEGNSAKVLIAINFKIGIQKCCESQYLSCFAL